jgi:ABC-type transport system involved in multi-copper enzyme maturation permease subunit
MRDLIVAELMKTRTRWLPYVLLIIMVLGVGVQIWLFGYTAWWDIHDDPSPDVRSDLPEIVRTFVFPWGFVTLLDVGQFWGSLIVGILVSSAVATEYNWGTVRQAIARGQSRAEWLTVKLGGLALLSAILLLIALAWGIVSVLWTTSLAGFDITMDPPGPAELSAAEMPIMVLRAAFCILPYALLAFAITVVGRSTALGATGIILFLIIESTLVPIFGALPDPWPSFRSVTIAHNASAVLSANKIDDGAYFSLALRETPDSADLPDPWTGFIVLTIWCAALLGITYYIFQKRDLRLGTGE